MHRTSEQANQDYVQAMWKKLRGGRAMKNHKKTCVRGSQFGEYGFFVNTGNYGRHRRVCMSNAVLGWEGVRDIVG